MDRKVDSIIGLCQVSRGEYRQDPLRPNRTPSDLWDMVYTDHWGPTQIGECKLVLIDMPFRYPEVVKVLQQGLCQARNP